MKRLVFAESGDLATATGGYVYDRRILEGLRALGWDAATLDLGEGFPFPDAERRSAAAALLRHAPAGGPIVIDGLALGVLPEVASALCATRDLVALVHHPLAYEWGLAADAAAVLRASERAGLTSARRVVATSAFTARLLVVEYGVAPERLAVVRPGADRAAKASGNPGGPANLLAVGAVTPRKGYDVLLAACASLRDISWRLTIVGDLSRSVEAVARLRADIARFELADRVAVMGVVDAGTLERLYMQADLFVLASYFEGYGMAYGDAIAHGVPIVGVAGGAVPETAPPEVALLTPPGDVPAFAGAMRRLIENPDERRAFSARAYAHGAALPSWAHAAQEFAEAIEAAC